MRTTLRRGANPPSAQANTMNPVVILPVLALVTLAAPRSAAASGDSAPVVNPAEDALTLAVPQTFRDDAERMVGLTGYALRDLLDEVAASAEFWAGFQSIMTALQNSSHAQRQIDEFMRSEASRHVAPPGVPPHVMFRAMTAASAVAELLPPGLLLTAVMEQAADDFKLIADGIEGRLQDRTTPVALRRMERRAVRGIAAVMLLAALGNTAEPALCAELLGIYADGMENTVCFIAIGLDGDEAVKADAIIRELRLEVPDRAALRWRAGQLATAESALASTAGDLDGKVLRLPPDPGFRPADS